MFGTIFRMRPKQGEEQTVEQLFRRWSQERQPQTAGFVDGYLFRSRSQPGELTAVVVFASEAEYRDNAAHPEQDRWYRELRAALRADPEWNDADVAELGG